MNHGTMTSKGQITIPVAIREQFGLEAGVRVEFMVTSDGAIQLWPLKGTAESFFSALDGFERTAFSGSDDEAIAETLRENTSPLAPVDPEIAAEKQSRGAGSGARIRAA